MRFITTYCHITNDNVTIDNTLIFSNNGSENWLKDIYKHIGIDYPKFYKMDKLAKVGFLGVEILKQKEREQNKI